MKPISALFYGWAGVGKTAMGVSAFWDFKQKKQIRDGRWLLIGHEDNDALGVPENLIVRFGSPASNPREFIDKFSTYLQAAAMKAGKSSAPEVFFIDSLSEWNILFIVNKALFSDQRKMYGEAKERFLQAIQLLHPKVLNAHVIASARVVSRREGQASGGLTGGGADPDWVNYDYFPAMEGWPRQNISHYFDIVSFVDVASGQVKVGDKTVTVRGHHRYRFIPDGDALVKNRWEHLWLAAGQPPHLTNIVFDDILGVIAKLDGGGEPQVK